MEKKTWRKDADDDDLSDAPLFFPKRPTVELFQKQINKPFESSRPWSRRLRAEKSQIPGAKEGSPVSHRTEFPVSERDRDTGLVNFLHFYIFLPKEKQVLSSVISIDYIICTWIMLQKAERDGPEASTKTEKKHDPFPDIPIPEIPQIDRRSEFRNPVWLPQLTHGYTAYQLPMILAPSWPSSKPDTSGARVFIGPPRFFSAPKEIPKEASDPPAKSACQRS